MEPAKNISMVRIVLADHQTLFREGIRQLLEAERGLLIVGEANDGREALKLTRQFKPDILLLNWAISRRAAIDVLREVGPASSTRVIILIDEVAHDDILAALELGVRGLVPTASNRVVLIRTIRGVANGQYWVGGKCAADLIHAYRTVAVASGVKESPRHFGLTARESEIVSAVAFGCANKDIARRFSISEKTVKHHLSNVFGKIGVSNRLQLAVFALNHRLEFCDLVGYQRH